MSTDAAAGTEEAAQADREAWRARRLPPVQALGGGVWSIPVPIPDSPLRYTLVYLLESDRGPVLVDTGWDDPAGYRALAEGVAAAGASLAEVHGILVTHHHPDHHGLSARVRAESGAWIAMHGAEAAVVRASREHSTASWALRMLRALDGAGLPPEAEQVLLSFQQSTAVDADGCESGGPSAEVDRIALSEALPDRELVHGESAGVPGRDLRVLWTPGHTPGHVCLHLDEALPSGERGRLLSGDHLLPTISPVVSLYPEQPGLGELTGTDADPLGDFLDSLERIAALAPAEVLPAHQYRFRDAAGRVRELLDHHALRLAELHTALRAEPLTLWQAAAAMRWNRPWDELGLVPRFLALSEASAHLRRLVKTGLAEVIPDGDPILYRGW